AEQNERLAYTTRVNCAETTITLCADKAGSHNKDYVKSNNKRNKNQYVEAVACYFPTPATSHGSFRNRVLS
ncbi:hypothetical protein, partial [Klebsiella grimontii]|uniref:hypothetical protein n=1 Tax=Klebsiella grimontii TaxID=2058152 RepID=UPI001C7FF5D2